MCLTALEDLTRSLAANPMAPVQGGEELLDLISDMVIVFDNQGKLLQVNRAGQAVLTKPAGEGMSIEDLIPEVRSLADHLRRDGAREDRYWVYINGVRHSVRTWGNQNDAHVIVISRVSH